MNILKIGALGALVVLGGSVYGMGTEGSPSKELTQGLLQHAQLVLPESMSGAGVLPLQPSTPPKQTPTGSPVSTPMITPVVSQKSSPERDIESGEVVAKSGCLSSLKGRLAGWFKPCTDVTKKCWSGMPRFGKDAIEAGLLTVADITLLFQGNDYFAFIFALAAGQTESDIFERHKDWAKVLVCALVIAGCEGLKLSTGFDCWTIEMSAAACAIHSVCNDYEIATGRRNILPEVLRNLSKERKAALVAQCTQIARQVRDADGSTELKPVSQ